MEKAKRLLMAVGILAFTEAGYNFIQSLGSKNNFKLYSWVDDLFPLYPWWILVYASIFLTLVGAGWFLEQDEFMVTFKRVVLAQLASFVFFAAMPVSYPRPCFMTVQEGLMRWGFYQMHSIDGPNNTFPSMHVSLTCVVMYQLARNGIPRWLCLVYTALICLSTLFTKQHFAVDILGGIGIFGLTWLLIKDPAKQT